MEPRKCAYCGKEFIPRSNHAIYCKGPHYMTCPVCGKEYLVTNNDKLKFPPTACSYKCRTIRRTQTSLQRYGCIAPGNNPEARKKASQTMMEHLGVPYAMMSESVRNKSKETNLKKYGFENPGSSPEVIAKRMVTNLEKYDGVMPFNKPEVYQKRHETVMAKYGTEVFSAPEIREKIEDTMLSRYGARYMMQVPELKAKQQNSLFKHYGVKSAFSSPEIREKIKQTMIERYGVENPAYSEEMMRKAEQTMIERYGRCARISKINLQFLDLLRENGIDAESEKFVYGKWFDFCIEDAKLFIEINPTYTHSIMGNHWGKGVPVDYHLAKTNLAAEIGYRCIHVWDWDDQNKIISLIKPKDSIDAEDCKIFKLYPKVAAEFLREHHLQGSCRGQLICFGLLYNDELVEVMTFGKPRYDKSYSIELLRLCTRSDLQVIGGASKLFKFAMQYIEPESVVSYCDISKFRGDVYSQLGMRRVRRTLPQEIWSKNTRYITSNLLRQRGYDQLFHTNYGKDVSSERLMLDNGWLPVYNCGHDVYEYRV